VHRLGGRLKIGHDLVHDLVEVGGRVLPWGRPRARKLEQIVDDLGHALGLIGNAVKYLEDGRHGALAIAVHVIVRGSVARIEVEDTGPGLPPDAEQRVFEPFQRLSTGKPGIGLGLATVKKIVEAYLGRVGVHSALGQGTTFWFELPVAASPAPSASPGRDEAPGRAG